MFILVCLSFVSVVSVSNERWMIFHSCILASLVVSLFELGVHPLFLTTSLLFYLDDFSPAEGEKDGWKLRKSEVERRESKTICEPLLLQPCLCTILFVFFI